MPGSLHPLKHCLGLEISLAVFEEAYAGSGCLALIKNLYESTVSEPCLQDTCWSECSQLGTVLPLPILGGWE